MAAGGNGGPIQCLHARLTTRLSKFERHSGPPGQASRRLARYHYQNRVFGRLSCEAPCLAAGRRGLPFAELSGAHLGARRPGVCLVQLSNASPDSFPLFPWVVPMQVLAKGSLGESMQQPSLTFITFLNGKSKENTTASFYLVSLVGSFSSISKQVFLSKLC